ncbi:MAG: hypothetical protein SFY68_10425, partial [Candidatus Sumerlaeia bacterium]|nr:hypothetical protein [Candidatus Sumerlaeia bacterium]
MKPTSLLLALSLTLCGRLANAQDDQPLTHSILLGQYSQQIQFAAQATNLSSINNPGFEDLNRDLLPEFWERVGSPLVVRENDTVRVRVSANNRFQQEFLLPYQNQHITFYGRVQGEYGNEFPAVSFFQRSGPVENISERFQRFRVRLQSKGTQEVFHPLDLVNLPGINPRMLLIPSSNDRFNWVDWEEVGFLTSAFLNPNFSQPFDSQKLQPWIVQPSAKASNPLLLPPGGSISQRVSFLNSAHVYLLSVTASSTTQNGSLEVVRTLHNTLGSVVEERTIGTLEFTSVPTTLFLEDSATTSTVTPLATYSFVNMGDAPIQLQEIQRGYALVTPENYNPGDSIFYPNVESLVVWPDPEAQLTLQYLSPDSNVQREVQGNLTTGPHRDSWRPTDPVAGEWNLQVSLNHQGTTGTLSLPFQVSEPLVLPENVPSVHQSEFELSAWLWLRGLGNTPEQLRPYIQQLKEDGFDYAVIFAAEDQWSAVRTVTDEADFPFVSADFSLINFYKGQPPRNAIRSSIDYRNEADRLFAPLLGSTQWRGIYLMDEPFGEYDAFHASLQNRALLYTADPKPGYAVIAVSDATPDALQRIQPARFWAGIYPTSLTSPNLATNLQQVRDSIGTNVALAQQLSVPHAYLAQAFEIPDSFRMGPLGMLTSTIGSALAQQTNGFHLFAYYSISTIEGVRNIQNDLQPWGETWLQQAARLRQLRTQLPTLIAAEPLTTQNHIIFRTFNTPDGQQVLFLTSIEPRQSIQVEIRTDLPLSLFEPTLNQTLSSVNQRITTTLSPGEWRYWIASEKDSILTIDASVVAPVPTLPSPPVTFDRSFSTPGLRGARYSPSGNSYALVGTNHTTFVSGPFVSSASVGTSNVRLAFPDNQQWLIGDDTLGV